MRRVALWLGLIACRTLPEGDPQTHAEQSLAATCQGVGMTLSVQGADVRGHFVNHGDHPVTLTLPGRARPGRWEPAAAPAEDCDEKSEPAETVVLAPGATQPFEPWGAPATAGARYHYESDGCVLEAALPAGAPAAPGR